MIEAGENIMSDYEQQLEAHIDKLESKLDTVFNGELDEYILIGFIEKLNQLFRMKMADKFEETFRLFWVIDNYVDLISWANIEWIVNKIDPDHRCKIRFSRMYGDDLKIDPREMMENYIVIGVCETPVVVKSRYTERGKKGMAECMDAIMKTMVTCIEADVELLNAALEQSSV
jgi:hypothetical protein